MRARHDLGDGACDLRAGATPAVPRFGLPSGTFRVWWKPRVELLDSPMGAIRGVSGRCALWLKWLKDKRENHFGGALFYSITDLFHGKQVGSFRLLHALSFGASDGTPFNRTP